MICSIYLSFLTFLFDWRQKALITLIIWVEKSSKKHQKGELVQESSKKKSLLQMTRNFLRKKIRKSKTIQREIVAIHHSQMMMMKMTVNNQNNLDQLLLLIPKIMQFELCSSEKGEEPR